MVRKLILIFILFGCSGNVKEVSKVKAGTLMDTQSKKDSVELQNKIDRILFGEAKKLNYNMDTLKFYNTFATMEPCFTGLKTSRPLYKTDTTVKFEPYTVLQTINLYKDDEMKGYEVEAVYYKNSSQLDSICKFIDKVFKWVKDNPTEDHCLDGSHSQGFLYYRVNEHLILFVHDDEDIDRAEQKRLGDLFYKRFKEEW